LADPEVDLTRRALTHAVRVRVETHRLVLVHPAGCLDAREKRPLGQRQHGRSLALEPDAHRFGLTGHDPVSLGSASRTFRRECRYVRAISRIVIPSRCALRICP
jgi:hypothetical protein